MITIIPKDERELLARIEALPEPRHLFILPAWLDPAKLDELIDEGYLTYQHCQRNEKGAIQLVMGLSLMAKGKRLIQPRPAWRNLAIKGSLAGASFAAMSLVILYLG